MHLENLKNISKVSNNTINFNTKVIDIDFYNVTNRNLFLGHKGDNYLYAIHLIIPNLEDISSSEGGDNSSLSVRMAYQSKDMEEARTINGAMSGDGQYYFLIPNTITSKVGSGFIQFEISKISESSSGGDSTESSVKMVIAKSKRISYIIEESLEIGSEDEEIIEESSSKIEDIFSLLSTLSLVKAGKDEVYTKSEAMGRFTKRIYAHETHSSDYDADTNPVDTYSDGGVYIDEATDLDTWYIIKNSNNARVGILFCAAIPNSTYGKTQIALYYSGGFKYRYKHSNGGSWDEWENIARDSTVFDAVVRNYKDVAADITFNMHNTKVDEFLQTAAYDSSDYSYSNLPTADGTNWDRPNTLPVNIPSNSSKFILFDTITRTERVESTSGTTHTVDNLIPNRNYAYTVRKSDGSLLSHGIIKAIGQVRMINAGGDETNRTFNIRDLGGWSADGGKLKYGLVYRGGELNGSISISSAQQAFFKDVLGIRHEIDLRDSGEPGVGATALGCGVNYYHLATGRSPYILGDNDTYAKKRADVIKQLAKNIKNGEPTYIHCQAGADRTGVMCVFLKAICGVSQSDIDRDQELSYYSYQADAQRVRTRKNAWANGHRVMINGTGAEGYSQPYINNMEGSSFQDKIIRLLLRSGVTIDELNDIRFGLIDGNPTKLLNPYSSVAIANTLTNISNTNTSSSVVKYQPYEAELKVNNMCKLTSVTITMGGVDVTQQYYENGKINIPIVTGNLVISAEATQSSIITEGMIADEAVTKDKIKDGAVTPNKLGFRAVKYVSNIEVDNCIDADTIYEVRTPDGNGTTGRHTVICVPAIYQRTQYLFAQEGSVQFRKALYSNNAWGKWSAWVSLMPKTESFTVNSSEWVGLSYKMDSGMPSYANKNTKVDISLTESAYNQLNADGCTGLYVTTETSGSTPTFTLHAIGNAPTANITIQLTLQQIN